MYYSVDPLALDVLSGGWEEARDRLLQARGRLPDGVSVSGSAPVGSGFGDALYSLIEALRQCLGEAAQASDQTALALTWAAGAYAAVERSAANLRE